LSYVGDELIILSTAEIGKPEPEDRRQKTED
jgi:hypothetical protein